jgi:LmbE family N-acetylglucosaminyl deacetylase
MLKMRFGDVRSLLCIGCHADDIEIGCGGTLLRMLAERSGIDVRWVVLSADGDRAHEAVASAKAFLSDAATHRVMIKNFRDSFFPYAGQNIKEFLHELSYEVSPDLIFTHYRKDEHQDHRTVSELTRCAFRDHLIMEYEIPKYDGDLGRPNIFVPLDESICRRKVETITGTFVTQQNKQWFSDDTFWSVLRIRGLECNSKSRYAEGFHCHKLTL